MTSTNASNCMWHVYVSRPSEWHDQTFLLLRPLGRSSLGIHHYENDAHTVMSVLHKCRVTKVCLVLGRIFALWCCSVLHSLPNSNHILIYSHTELCLVQFPVYGQAIGKTVWSLRPGKEEDVEVFTAKFTLFWKHLCLASSCWLQCWCCIYTLATQSGSLYIFWSG